MADARPHVLISIVTFREPAHARDCLAALAVQSAANYSVVVTENGGSAAFHDLLEMIADSGLAEPDGLAAGGGALFRLAPGRQRLLVQDAGGNLGYGGGTNAAIAQREIPDWDAIWILNADTIPEPTALAALVARQREGAFEIVGSRIVFVASNTIQTWGGLGWQRWLGRGRLLGLDSAVETEPDIAQVEAATDFVSGASMLVTRRYIERFGSMEHRYFMYCEDVEFCLRGKRAGLGFGYAHGSVVRHIHGGTSGSSRSNKDRSAFNIYLSERNKVLLERAHADWLTPLVLASQLAYALVRYAIGARSLKATRTALAGWWAGLRGETGIPPRWQERPGDGAVK